MATGDTKQSRRDDSWSDAYDAAKESISTKRYVDIKLQPQDKTWSDAFSSGAKSVGGEVSTAEPKTVFIPFDETPAATPPPDASGKGGAANEPSFGVKAYGYEADPIKYLKKAQEIGTVKNQIKVDALNGHAITFGFNSWGDWVQDWKQNPDNMSTLTDALENQLGKNYKPFREALDWYEKNGLTLAEMPQLNKDMMMGTLIQTLAATIGDAAVGVVGGDTAAMARTTPTVTSQVSQDASNMLMTEIQKNEDMKHKTELMNLDIMQKYKGNLAQMKAAIDSDMSQAQREYMARRTQYLFNRQEAFSKGMASLAATQEGVQDDIMKEFVFNKGIEEKNVSNKMQASSSYAAQRLSADIHNQQMQYNIFATQQRAMSKMMGKKNTGDDKLAVALSTWGLAEAYNQSQAAILKNGQYFNNGSIRMEDITSRRQILRQSMLDAKLNGTQMSTVLSNYSTLASMGETVNLQDPEVITWLTKADLFSAGIAKSSYSPIPRADYVTDIQQGETPAYKRGMTVAQGFEKFINKGALATEPATNAAAAASLMEELANQAIKADKDNVLETPMGGN